MIKERFKILYIFESVITVNMYLAPKISRKMLSLEIFRVCVIWDDDPVTFSVYFV